nr:hypothetical protein [Tanacetum cinerariifolium]
SGAEDMLNAL